MRENAPTPPANAYKAKTSHESARLARRLRSASLPPPLGDPLSGVMLVAEAAASARAVDALQRSLVAVKLDDAYVTWPSSDLLQEILSLEPGALVAVGLKAARTIDALGYPLTKTDFSEAPEGSWFSWTRSISGLRLPALIPALDDTNAKRYFWRAFLALRFLDRNE